jgi:hypothetical protein
MPGLLLLLSWTSVMELLHWSITHTSKFMPVHTMEAYGGMKLQLCSFLTSVLDWGSGQLHDLTGLPQGKSPHSHWIAFWVGFEYRKLCCLIWESNQSFTVQNFIVQVIWHPQFVHPFFKLFLMVRVMVFFSQEVKRNII